MIITFEGTDQAGKKTQTAMLTRALRRAKLKCTTFSFPHYTTPIGRVLADLLAGRTKPDSRVLHTLMSANRWEMLPRIERAMDTSSVIIMNRYYHSNIAYGLANGLPRKWLETLDVGLPKSDLVILLDSTHAESVRRKTHNRDRFESDADFLHRVARNYRNMAKQHRWSIVDARADRKEIHDNVMRVISGKLKL